MKSFTARNAEEFLSLYDNTINNFKACSLANDVDLCVGNQSGYKVLAYNGTYNFSFYHGVSHTSEDMTPSNEFSRVECYQTSTSTIIKIYAQSPTMRIVAFTQNDNGDVYMIYHIGNGSAPTVYSNYNDNSVSYSLNPVNLVNVFALCNFAGAAGLGYNSILDNAFFMPISSDTTTGVKDIGGTDYLSVGYWVFNI